MPYRITEQRVNAAPRTYPVTFTDTTPRTYPMAFKSRRQAARYIHSVLFLNGAASRIGAAFFTLRLRVSATCLHRSGLAFTITKMSPEATVLLLGAALEQGAITRDDAIRQLRQAWRSLPDQEAADLLANWRTVQHNLKQVQAYIAARQRKHK